MITATVTYDVIFLVHIMVAVSVVTVFIVMRTAATQIVRGADSTVQRARFGGRRNWAARLLHVLPLTGLLLSLMGDSRVSLTRPWIGVGILMYLAAAGHLEARTLPLERVITEVVQHDGVASPERGRQLLKSVDTLLALIGVALVSMVVQF